MLEEMGLHQALKTVLKVDNSGAVELSRDRKSCHRSRHVDRRYFKVRDTASCTSMGISTWCRCRRTTTRRTF